ncbi:MAG TPA: NUDIX domain-containing protein, partial [Actinomycetes bacterium]|nr:NUDIX domain-containing protein [Actinomycetes bacterium]
VDETGAVVGAASRSAMRAANLAHLVVCVLLRDGAGRVYVHRRTDTKDVFPGAHDAFAAGCVLADEEPLQAAERELAEELGVTGVRLEPLFTQWYADEVMHHLCHVWTARYDGPVTHQPEEVAWGTWMTVAELRAHLADPAWPFVPDGRALVERLLDEGLLH